MYTNERLNDFTRAIRGKKVAVLGIARTNTPLIEFLCKYGARITAFDRAGETELKSRIEALKACAVEYRLGPGYLADLKGYDWVFRTPAIRPDLPELNDERERGAVVTSEMEMFLELCPCTVFGITGSDGKTTTSTLIYEMLKVQGYNCYLGGNIGKPLLQDVGAMSPSDMAVIELSSFQLLSIKKSPNVAVVTNLSPNHLDVHTSYAEYVGAKKNIFAHQSPDDLCVLNYDNEQTRALCGEAPGRLGIFTRTRGADLEGYISRLSGGAVTGPINGAAGSALSGATTGPINVSTGGATGAAVDPAANGNAVYTADGEAGLFSALNGRLPHAAAYISGENLVYYNRDSCDSRANRDCHGGNIGSGGSGASPVVRAGDIRIPGDHNIENYLAAVCAVGRYVGGGNVAAVARGFNGAEHRIEYVRTLGGVRYYNDAIATSPTRTLACLNTFRQKIILIAGGKDKNIDYAPLGRHLAENVRLLILCGQTAEKMKNALLGYCRDRGAPCETQILECDRLEDAVAAAYNNARANDVVVMSPAGTSFDRFRDFEEKGRYYKALVNALPER